MANFNIRIVESDENVHIYTDASSINITDDKIEIDYEDQHATHSMDFTDEITIKANRRD